MSGWTSHTRDTGSPTTGDSYSRRMSRSYHQRLISGVLRNWHATYAVPMTATWLRSCRKSTTISITNTWRCGNDLVTVLVYAHSRQDMDCVARTRFNLQSVAGNMTDFTTDFLVFATIIIIGLMIVYYYSNRKWVYTKDYWRKKDDWESSCFVLPWQTSKCSTAKGMKEYGQYWAGDMSTEWKTRLMKWNARTILMKPGQ